LTEPDAYQKESHKKSSSKVAEIFVMTVTVSAIYSPCNSCGAYCVHSRL